MLEALSTSRWRWTWWFLLLCCASALVLLLAALLSLLFPPNGGPAYYLAVLGFAGLAVGVIGALVCFVMTVLRRHSPPAKPVG
jgi:Na+/melibiose symporter-like transporter